MTPNSADLEALVRRLEVMEDKWEILHLLATYGPAVDSGSADAVAELWLDDGVYDVDSGMLDGQEDIREMVYSDQHQGFIMNGSAHMMSVPRIEVTADRAVVTGHTQLVIQSPGTDEFKVLRITANRWELVKSDGRWRVERRIARLLDGRADARALLGAAADASYPASATGTAADGAVRR